MLQRREFVKKSLIGGAALGLSALAAKVGAQAPAPAFTQVRVWVFTDDDDKDREESVTIRIKHSSGKVIGELTVGQNEVWDDKTERSFTVDLKEAMPRNKANEYSLVIEKSRHRHRNGYGWDFHARAWGVLPGNVEVQILKQHHAYLGRGHGHDNEPVVSWPCGK